MVLVAEDNPVNQKVVTRMLERLGYGAHVVGNGLEALDALEQRPYPLVFMDCQMPELDGYEATAQIRERYPDRQIAVVALTAHAMEGDRERCLAAGMDDYLAKPIDAGALRDVLARWLPAGAATPRTGTVPSEASPNGQLDAIDAERIRSLGLLEGGESIAAMFREDGEARLEALEAAHAAGDTEAARLAAHALKGSAANLGAAKLAEAASQIEDRARAGELAGDDDLRTLRDHFERVASNLETLEREVAA